MTAKTWFITGVSRGFGRLWAEAALERGDRVAATARRPADLDGLARRFGDRLLPIALDVTDRAAVLAALPQAAAHFGRLDVVVNNAGYGHFGMLEETSEAEARRQIEVNLFGALWVMQAAAPVLRRQGGGHLITVSSVGGIVAHPGLSLYCASKWAVEALNESFAHEVAAFGVKVTLVEPGAYDTDWRAASATRSTPLPAYAAAHARRAEQRAAMRPADPARTTAAILKLVDAPAPPLRLLLGETALASATAAQARRQGDWDAWADVTAQT